MAVGLCVAAALTTPFTPGAELTVAAGFVLILAVPLLRRTAATGAEATAPVPPSGSEDEPRRRGGRWALVGVPLVAALAWELVCFAHGDRAAWPTLSSLLDGVDSSPSGRGLVFAAWLGLGAALVTR